MHVMRQLHRHTAASEAIRHYIQLGRIGHYPMYLVGMALLEHRGGPALMTLLTLSDGSVLDAKARTLRLARKEPALSDRFQYDVHYLEVEDLERYQREFVALGGFAPTALESSPTVVAERLLGSSRLGLEFGPNVAASPMGPPSSFPSDWTDIAYYSEAAITCAIEGFAPSPDMVEGLDLPPWLKREMLVAHTPQLHWLDGLEPCLDHVDDRIPELVREAWHVRLVSPRASAVLLRTVAEVVASHLRETPGPLFRSINSLEKDWADEREDSTPSTRRKKAWRAQVVACLDTIRDTGNQIHADAGAIEAGDLTRSHQAVELLLETVAHPESWPHRIGR